MIRGLGRHRKKLLALALALGAPLLAHGWIRLRARLEPPPLTPPGGALVDAGSVRYFGASYVARRGALNEVRLVGSPTEIGWAHSRLLYSEMVADEGVVWDLFERTVPTRAARTLLFDLAELRYRSVDRGMSESRRLEIAAGALGFEPDPFSARLPTYQRFVYLNALYDISLSFEHSPLIGCTTLVIGPEHTGTGGSLLARAFDFDVDEVFDRDKTVFLVREHGAIPFASVAWPGLVGVLSGMNAEGVAVVVHGGRAGEPRAQGEPVVHALRRVLSTARDTDEAVAALAVGEPMVSHIVIVSDARGRSVAVERVPGRPQAVRALAGVSAVTNHFEGPSADDPRNARVRSETTTLARRARADEIGREMPTPATVEQAVAFLRDRQGAAGAPLALGDRRAIDALIATHGVVMDTARRTLWVSESPHLLGRFVAFDLGRMLTESYAPADPAPLVVLPADPLLTSGDYARWRSARP